jgi:hypothetical protein
LTRQNTEISFVFWNVFGTHLERAEARWFASNTIKVEQEKAANHGGYFWLLQTCSQVAQAPEDVKVN